MKELAAPLTQKERHTQTMGHLQALMGQKQLLELQIRAGLTKLALEDTPIAWGTYAHDHLAMLLAESPATAKRWLDEAQMFCDFPEVIEQVAGGTWTIRQADAVVEEIVFLRRDLRAEAVALVLSRRGARTPYELRRAARAAVTLLDLDAAQLRAEKARKDRHVAVVDNRDGSGSAIATGPKAQIAQLLASLDCLCLPAQPGDTRTLGQRRFDALMDLVCGRVLPGQWQAQLLVTLATVEGTSDAPAEVPGLGLITAEEARELIAHASIRRIVIDENGALVSVDSKISRPDAAQDVDVEEALLSKETEPEAESVDEADLLDPEEEWISAEEAADLDEEADRAFQTGLAELLDSASATRPVRVLVLCGEHGQGFSDGPDHAPPPPGGGGGSPPPSSPDQPGQLDPEPDPPTPARRQDPDQPICWTDQDWEQASLARQLDHLRIDQLVAAARPGGSLPVDRLTGEVPPAAPRRSWSDTGLRAALSKARTSEVEPKPATSHARLFTGRLARWIRTRDQTCTFPGCWLLARLCQNDHVKEHPVGPTHVDNGALECVHHHQAKHGYFSVTRLANGIVRWTAPNGLTVDRYPRSLVPGQS